MKDVLTLARKELKLYRQIISALHELPEDEAIRLANTHTKMLDESFPVVMSYNQYERKVYEDQCLVG